MTGFDFYVDVIAHGNVLGVGLDSSVSDWGFMGDDYIDDIRKNLMRRDYGLIELSFEKKDEEWFCFAISIQVHRLAVYGPEKLVPLPLVNRYGRFENFTSCHRLLYQMTKQGYTVNLLKIQNRSLDFRNKGNCPRDRRFWFQ